jgi:hypothetical protein
MNSNNKLNVRTRFGHFLEWSISLDIMMNPAFFNFAPLINGDKGYNYPQSLCLSLKFLKKSVVYHVDYEARNVSDKDILLIQSELIKYLRREASKTKFGGYPKTFMVGEAKFQLKSITTGEAQL